MTCRRELVALECEIVLARASDRDRGGVELELGAFVEMRARLHDETAALHRKPEGARSSGLEHETLLGQARVPAHRADDSPDEEIEQDEERDLQHEQKLLEPRAGDDHSSSVVNVTSVEPTVNDEPGSSFARFTRRPPTSTPFVESRSTIQYPDPS